MRPQRELLRVASANGKTPVVDAAQCAPGRGAYVCYNDACHLRARQRRAFERALKLCERIPHCIWEELAKKAGAGKTAEAQE